MKKIIYLFSFLLLATNGTAQIKAIKVNEKNGWELKTRSSVYQLAVSGSNEVNFVFFGNQYKENRPVTLNLKPQNEVTVRGGAYINTPVLECIFADHVRDIELVYEKYEILSMDGYQTLAVYQKDKFYPLTVIEYLRVLPEYDLIEKWMEIKNTEKKGTINLENAQSGSFFLPKDAYQLTQLSGKARDEFQPSTSKLTQGTKTIQVKDFKSYGSSFFAVRPEGENSETLGKVWFGMLHYSGNWRMDFDKAATGELQICGGVNFWDQEINLKEGTSFVTPKMVIGYTEQGMEGTIQSLTNYTRKNILPKTHRDKIRPVLYNSWYATTFHVNEEQQISLAKVAKELGAEMFVVDDGWFKGRLNAKAGLGDWTVDKTKFPNGLTSLIQNINAIGLDFGIWVEPEMVNPNSDLYRSHPDWVLNYPTRQRHEGRNQLMLNMARPDVCKYLYECLSKLLKENNIKYLKWDMNKPLTDPGFPTAPIDEQRAVRVKYIENLYAIIDRLRAEFPDVWIENCSSGSGRVDLGMISRTDICWLSDNTDPVDRTFIQYSYLNAFPANTMINWVTQEDPHKQSPSLDFKFDVSMCGVLGIGYDITKWKEDQKTLAKNKISTYKEIRNTVQSGNQYRLVSPFENNRSVLQFVNEEKTQSVLFIYNLVEYPDNSVPDTKRSPLIKLRGLQQNVTYSIEGIGEFNSDYLMNIGIDVKLKGAFKSGIYKINKL